MSNEPQNPNPLAGLEATVALLERELNVIVGDQEVTSINILIFTLSFMQVVERYKNLKGSQKKLIVTRVFQKYLQEHGGDMSLMVLLPSFIDTSIQLDKGEVTIRMNADQALSCCLGCLAKKH